MAPAVEARGLPVDSKTAARSSPNERPPCGPARPPSPPAPRARRGGSRGRCRWRPSARFRVGGAASAAGPSGGIGPSLRQVGEEGNLLPELYRPFSVVWARLPAELAVRAAWVT